MMKPFRHVHSHTYPYTRGKNTETSRSIKRIALGGEVPRTCDSAYNISFAILAHPSVSQTGCRRVSSYMRERGTAVPGSSPLTTTYHHPSPSPTPSHPLSFPHSSSL